MTIISVIDTITEWLNENVCGRLAFKKAPPVDRPDGEYYEHEIVPPKAWQIYKPALDIAKFFDYDCPCVVVQPITVKVSPASLSVSSIRVRFSYLTWSPGEHIEDVYDLMPDTRTVFAPQIGEFEQRTRYDFRPDESGCKIDDDGWRDVFNFLETTLDTLAKKEISGLSIDPSEEIYATPYDEESVSTYFWPYHFARLEMTFKVNDAPLTARSGDYEKYL